MQNLRSGVHLVQSGLRNLPALTATLQNLLPVLVQLQLVDDHLGGSDGNRHALAVGLLAGDALDVDAVLQTVDGSDLALTALVDTSSNGDFVILADRDGLDLRRGIEMSALVPARQTRDAQWCDACAATVTDGETYVVFLAEFLAQRSAHEDAADRGGSGEVLLSALSPGGVLCCNRNVSVEPTLRAPDKAQRHSDKTHLGLS